LFTARRSLESLFYSVTSIALSVDERSGRASRTVTIRG